MTAHHRRWALLVPLAVAVLVVTACGTATTPTAGSNTNVASQAAAAKCSAGQHKSDGVCVYNSQPPAVSASAPSLTCSTATNDNGMTASQVIAQLVSDQKSQDASEEQNWVDLLSGNQTSQGNNLAAAAQSLGGYGDGSQVAADGSQLATDVQTFLTDQDGGLMPGWVGEYRHVETDIHKLADDCGQHFHRPPGA